MEPLPDSNEAIWKSPEHIRDRELKAQQIQRENEAQWRLMGHLLPFDPQDSFTFLDLGAGTGHAARGILDLYPQATAILADFSPEMIAVGSTAMAPYARRYRYVTLDMMDPDWPADIPSRLDAIITSMSIHHMPDERKQGLFEEIYARLVPGGWYLNYDCVSAADPVVVAAWGRAADRLDPVAAEQHRHRTPQEQARHDNHVRYLIPLPQQLGYLEAAGFEHIDVFWKHLDDVLYGGCRPA